MSDDVFQVGGEVTKFHKGDVVSVLADVVQVDRDRATVGIHVQGDVSAMIYLYPNRLRLVKRDDPAEPPVGTHLDIDDQIVLFRTPRGWHTFSKVSGYMNSVEYTYEELKAIYAGSGIVEAVWKYWEGPGKASE